MAKIDLHGRPVRGADSAKVTIVNFDDFQCPYCSAMHQTLFPDLVKSYGDKLKVIYKDYPLIRIHPWAMHAAIDANCLADQNSDAYWEFADYAHRSQPELSSKEKGNDPLQKLDAKVGEIGKLHKVDAGKLDACVKKQSDTAVQASMAEGDKLGVDSTPTMFINGEKLSGALPAEVLRAAIDRALKAVGETPPAAPSPAKPAGN
jgi:protein-disulfide isomerase